MENIINTIIHLFGGLLSLKYGKELLVFIISLLPILELRGGILAASLINLDPINAYISAMIGNIIPVPFILLVSILHFFTFSPISHCPQTFILLRIRMCLSLLCVLTLLLLLWLLFLLLLLWFSGVKFFNVWAHVYSCEFEVWVVQIVHFVALLRLSLLCV